MANRQELLERWGCPYVQHHGVTLVARDNAAACLDRINAEGRRVFGYDSFTAFPDNSIQPHMDWSPSWSRQDAPEVSDIKKQILNHPLYVTHYEFVFTSDD